MKISIITVCYNSASTLNDTLQSVLGQTWKNLEYIVVDGGSSDNTVDMLKKAASELQERLIWISEPDRGIYDAMNKGIRMATGEVIGFLNADGYYQDSRVLEDIAQAFLQHNPDSIHGSLHYINDARQVSRTWHGTPYRSGAFQKGWMPAHPTFYCKRKCFEEYGVFDTTIGSAADFELMLRFIEKHRISTQHLDRFMVFMRKGDSSTAGIGAVLRNTRQNKRAFRQNGIPFPWYYDISRLIPKITKGLNLFKYIK